jgi:hypothetical protein
VLEQRPAPKHTKAPPEPPGSPEEAAAREAGGEGAAAAQETHGRGPAPSKGAEAFDSVKDGARHTRRGLRRWQEAARWATLAELLGLVAAALLVVVVGLASVGFYGAGSIGLAGMYIGVASLLMWLWALFHYVRGLRSARAGRDELGFLQRRQVDATTARSIRAVAGFAVVGAVAIFLTLQAETVTRAGRLPDAALFGLAVAAVAGVLAVLPTTRGIEGVLRNLTPSAGKRSRRRFILLANLWAVPVIAAYLVGSPFAVLDYEVACQDFGACRSNDLVPLASPAYGAPIAMLSEPPAALSMEAPLVGALVLFGARLAGFQALRLLRSHLEEADLFLVNHVAARAMATARAETAA